MRKVAIKITYLQLYLKYRSHIRNVENDADLFLTHLHLKLEIFDPDSMLCQKNLSGRGSVSFKTRYIGMKSVDSSHHAPPVFRVMQSKTQRLKKCCFSQLKIYLRFLAFSFLSSLFFWAESSSRFFIFSFLNTKLWGSFERQKSGLR